jgi:hypothetical protein
MVFCWRLMSKDIRQRCKTERVYNHERHDRSSFMTKVGGNHKFCKQATMRHMASNHEASGQQT